MSDYNLELFEQLSTVGQFNFRFFFDFPLLEQEQTFLWEKSKSLVLFTGKNLSAIKYELYLSYGFLCEVIKERPEIVVSEDGGNIINNFVLLLLSRLLGFELVLWGLGRIRGRQQSSVRRLAERVLMFIWRKSSLIFSYSSYGREYYISRGVAPDNVVNVRNAIPGSKKEWKGFCDPSRKVKANDPLKLAFVGRLIPSKRVDLLLDALKLLFERDISIRLETCIIGDGPLRVELESQSIDSGNHAVEFFGQLQGEELDQILLECDLGVLPGEGGLAINTLLSRGLPVVLSDSGGDGTELDLIAPGVNGEFFRSGDARQMSFALEKVIKNLRVYSQGVAECVDNLPTTTQQAMDMIQALTSLSGDRVEK